MLCACGGWPSVNGRQLAWLDLTVFQSPLEAILAALIRVPGVERLWEFSAS